MAAETPKERSQIIVQGDGVTLTDNRTGRVAFIGSVDGKTDTQFGIVLDKQFKGDTNGTINNICYFKATNNRGVFITQAQIKKSKCKIFLYVSHLFVFSNFLRLL